MKKNNKKNNYVKYRLIVVKENEIMSWRDIEWQGNNKWDSELDKKYCKWLGKKIQHKSMNNQKIEERVLEVHVQIGDYDKQKRKYKWKDHDYKCSSEEIPYHMR